MTTRTTTARKAAAKRAPAKKTAVEVVPAEADTTDADLELDAALELDDEDEFPEIPEELRFDTIDETAELEELAVVFNDPDSGPFKVVIKQPTMAFLLVRMNRFFYPGSKQHEHVAGMMDILHHCLDDAGISYIDTMISRRGVSLDPELLGRLVELIFNRWASELAPQVDRVREKAKNRAQRRAAR